MMTQTKTSLLLASVLFAGISSTSFADSVPASAPPSAAAAGENLIAKAGLNPTGKTQRGIASFYTDHRTASGERFSAKALTAAHPTLPLGTRVLVTCLRSGRCTIVRINDRGPFMRGRIIDLTPAAAEKIGLTKARGLAKVELAVLR